MNTNKNNLPLLCPSCSGELAVSSLVCSSCKTKIDGLFTLPLLARLTREEQSFIIQFVKASGSLKEMASLMKLSYPTVRNQLDDLIGNISTYEKEGKIQ